MRDPWRSYVRTSPRHLALDALAIVKYHSFLEPVVHTPLLSKYPARLGTGGYYRRYSIFAGVYFGAAMLP